jgi:hypothetical protein
LPDAHPASPLRARPRSGEPGGNRTLNPQIKSGFEEAKAFNILRIVIVVCADDGKARHPGVTSKTIWQDKGLLNKLALTVIPLGARRSELSRAQT